MPHEAKSPTDKMGKMGGMGRMGKAGGLGTDLLYQLVWPAGGACGSQRVSVVSRFFLKFRVDKCR